MSECYVCGRQFQSLVAKYGPGVVPRCVSCLPKQAPLQTITVKAETARILKERMFKATYVKAGCSVGESLGLFKDSELRAILYGGGPMDHLRVKDNGPHRTLPGNVFWEEVIDSPMALFYSKPFMAYKFDEKELQALIDADICEWFNKHNNVVSSGPTSPPK